MDIFKAILGSLSSKFTGQYIVHSELSKDKEEDENRRTMELIANLRNKQQSETLYRKKSDGKYEEVK